MRLQFKQIEAFVKKPFPEALAILVYGPDEGLIRERANLMAKTVVEDITDPFNVAEMSGDQAVDKPSAILDEAKSISMLGGRRVILIREAGDDVTALLKETLAALKPGDNLIIVKAGELGPRSSLRLLFEQADNAAAVPCYVEDERDISRIIADDLKSSGYTISSEALQHMAANVVGDRGVARSEAEKLILYMGGRKSVAIEDVVACVGDSASLSMDALWKAAGSGKFAEADRVRKSLMGEGTPAVPLLRSLQTHFTRLHVTKTRLAKGDSLELALKKLKPEVFWKNKAPFEAQLYGLSTDQIEQILLLLVGAEAKCKQTGADPDLLCSRAILSLSQITGRALSRRRA
jgi:DNA polymerase-3 subunit delta